MSVTNFKISPRFDSMKLSNPAFDDYVDVYEDRVRGWLIDSGRILNQHEHAGFGVLQISLAYFEGHTIFYEGQDSRNKSKEFFKKGFLSVFPHLNTLEPKLLDEVTDIMYTDGRCGLFHIGMARSRIILSDGSPIFRVALDQNGTIRAILIDRQGIIHSIDEHLSNYVARLRNPNEIELRQRFEAAWKLVHE